MIERVWPRLNSRLVCHYTRGGLTLLLFVGFVLLVRASLGLASSLRLPVGISSLNKRNNTTQSIHRGRGD